MSNSNWSAEVLDVPPEAHKSYRSPHLLPRAPHSCKAPYGHRRPKYQVYAMDTIHANDMPTDGLVDDLESIRVPCSLPENPTHREVGEGILDLNQLAFYQEDAVTFPEKPYVPNGYVVPRSWNKDTFIEETEPPIYVRDAIERTWPKDAVHPEQAKEYYNAQGTEITQTENLDLPPREYFFLAKEGIADIRAGEVAYADGFAEIKAPVAVKIQPKFLRGSTAEFEPLPSKSLDDDDDTQPPAVWESFCNFVTQHEPTVYDEPDSLFGSLWKQIDKNKQQLLTRKFVKGQLECVYKEWDKYMALSRTKLEERTTERRERAQHLATIVLQMEPAIQQIFAEWGECGLTEEIESRLRAASATVLRLEEELRDAAAECEESKLYSEGIAEEGLILGVLVDRVNDMHNQFWKTEWNRPLIDTSAPSTASTSSPSTPYHSHLYSTAVTSNPYLTEADHTWINTVDQTPSPAIKKQDSGHFSHDSPSRSDLETATSDSLHSSPPLHTHPSIDHMPEFGTISISSVSRHSFPLSRLPPLKPVPVQQYLRDLEDQIRDSFGDGALCADGGGKMGDSGDLGRSTNSGSADAKDVSHGRKKKRVGERLRGKARRVCEKMLRSRFFR